MAFLALQAYRAYWRIYWQRLAAEAKGRAHSRADAAANSIAAGERARLLIPDEFDLATYRC
jgi:hypothetical protein